MTLLRGLFESRLKSTEQITKLYFDGRGEAAKKRLQILKRAGLVSERKRRAFEPSILSLTKHGLEILKEKGILAEYPSATLTALERRAQVSASTVRHELDVVEVKIALHLAVKDEPTLSVAEFSTWPALYLFEAELPALPRPVTVKPDGFIRLHEQDEDGGLFEHSFFLEVDRSTETLDVLTDKALCYLNFYRSGGFAVRNGGDLSSYNRFPFRVLMVFKTTERRNNIAEALLRSNPPIFTQVYLSTMEEVTTAPLASIWIRPLDFQTATQGTPFDPALSPRKWGYQRQTAREVFVEGNVQKCSLLSEPPSQGKDPDRTPGRT